MDPALSCSGEPSDGRRSRQTGAVPEQPELTIQGWGPAAHRPWLEREIGPLGVEVLRAVKERLDPRGICNPGVLLPD